MPEYNIFRITDKERGNPRATVRMIDCSVSDEIPEGAVSIPDLRAAELTRAESVRRRMSTAVGALFVRESAEPHIEVEDLLSGLRSGAVAYEPALQEEPTPVHN